MGAENDGRFDRLNIIYDLAKQTVYHSKFYKGRGVWYAGLDGHGLAVPLYCAFAGE